MVADVNVEMDERAHDVTQRLQVPVVTASAEELLAQVAVEAEHSVPLPVEMLYRLRAKEAAAAGNEDLHARP